MSKSSLHFNNVTLRKAMMHKAQAVQLQYAANDIHAAKKRKLVASPPPPTQSAHSSFTDIMYEVIDTDVAHYFFHLFNERSDYEISQPPKCNWNDQVI